MPNVRLSDTVLTDERWLEAIKVAVTLPIGLRHVETRVDDMTVWRNGAAQLSAHVYAERILRDTQPVPFTKNVLVQFDYEVTLGRIWWKPWRRRTETRHYVRGHTVHGSVDVNLDHFASYPDMTEALPEDRFGRPVPFSMLRQA